MENHKPRSNCLAVFIVLAGLLVLVNARCFAAEKPIWVEAEGEAILGEMDTPKEVVDRSRKDALSKAVEKAAGIFLKTHTLVSNSQISEDLIYASVKGEIIQNKIVRAGWDLQDRNIYKTSLRALVKPIYPEKGEGLSARVFLSKSGLKEGESVKIFYRTSSDSYVYLFCVAADGSVTLLFPNAQARENKALAGKSYEFPPAGSPINLQAVFLPNSRGPAEEKIKLIATKEREELIPLGFQEGTFQVYTAESTGMISDLVRKLNHLEPDKWTEATVVYTINR